MSKQKNVMDTSGKKMTCGTGTTGAEIGPKAVLMQLQKVNQKAKEQKEKVRAKVKARLGITFSTMPAHTKEAKANAKEQVRTVTTADMRGTWPELVR